MNQTRADELMIWLIDAGVSAFSGVPCSWLGGLFSLLEREYAASYVAACVEGESVAMAAGAWLGGGLGCALLQNSGLGNIVNPVMSLLWPYKIPALLIVSWRGQPGLDDASHHELMGAQTPALLELMGIKTLRLDQGPVTQEAVSQLIEHAKAAREPVALLVPKGAISTDKAPRVSHKPSPARSAQPPTLTPDELKGAAPLTRAQAIDALVRGWTRGPIFSTTGYTSRALSGEHDRDSNFYMQGSMGFAATIALGWSRQRGPNAQAMILDGDGALLMRLGSLATVAAHPAPLLHIVLDNGTYASTGGQRTSAEGVSFVQAAYACGYAFAAHVQTLERLHQAQREAMAHITQTKRAALLHVMIDAGAEAASSRPEQSPQALATRFSAWSAGHSMTSA